MPKVEHEGGHLVNHRTGGALHTMTEIASRGQLLGALMRWVAVFVPAMLLLGFLSAAASNSGEQNAWFAALIKPALYPPAQVFPLVWSVAYVLMGLALAIIASARGSAGRGLAITMFALHVVLNLVWSPLFFGGHRIVLALVDIAAMGVTLALSILLFARLRPVAAWLLVPVMGWIIFAGVLNWQIQVLNPGADGAADPVASVHVKF